MLRPEKGEGERPAKSYNSIRKAPLIFTTALLVGFPLCLGQVAMASTSSFGLDRPQYQSQTAQGTLKQSQPKSYQGSRLLSSTSLPSESEISSLESILSGYKSKLTSLEAKVSSDRPELAKLIPPLKQEISLLEEDIANAKALRAALATNISSLTKATDKYNGLLKTKSSTESALDQAKATLATVTANYTAAKSTATVATTNLSNATTELATAKATLTTATTNLTKATTAYEQAVQSHTAATARLAQATIQQSSTSITVAQATSLLSSATSQLAQATLNVTTAQVAKTVAQSQYSTALTNYNSANAAAEQAQTTYNSVYQQLQNANQVLAQAQADYDTNLIPDPNWVAPTQQVAHTRLVPRTETVYTTTLVPHTTTTLQEQTIPNLLFNSTLTNTEGWSGVYAGWQDSHPGMYNGQIVFSYQNQTVSQGLYSGPFENATLTLSADWFSDWTADSYSMTITAEDINRNPVGTATYTNTRTSHDWTNRSVTLQATGPVSYITVSFSGIDHGFWLGNYGPQMKNPALQVSYGQYVTETTYEEVTTSEEVTTMVEEIYYTTEVIQPQQGLTVRVYNNLPTSNPERSDTAYNLCKTTTLTSINHQWGGGDILGCGNDRVMIHYTGYITPTENIASLQNIADDGFYMDVNGVNAINNWTLKGCSGNWNPVNLQAGQSYAIDAWFFEWGGGACSILNYQSANGQQGVVPEAWYSNGASAPLIKNPALLPAVQAAQEVVNSLSTQLAAASSDLASAIAVSQEQQVALAEATNSLDTAETNLAVAESAKTQAQLSKDSAESGLDAAEASLRDADEELVSATDELEITSLTLTSATTDKAQAQSVLDTATLAESAATVALATAESELATAQTNETLASTEVAAAEAIVVEKESLDTAAAEELESALEEKTSAETATSTSQNEYTSVIASASSIEPDFSELETELAKPKPEEEVGSKEIPEDLSAENLMEVNLEEVDPTELTEAQAEQLVAAALETFETAEEGSPEYQQALEALFVAAQQDDIELPEELAAIPGLAAAVEVLNFLGNAGADMSPKVREESEKVVVATVIAAGAAIQAAAGAAASAAVSASAPSGGSRRVGK